MRSHCQLATIALMTAERPRNPYDAARDRMRRQDREAMSRYGRPLGPFLAKQVAASLAAGLVGYLIGGWITATVLFLGWLLPSIGGWLWGRHTAQDPARRASAHGEAG